MEPIKPSNSNVAGDLSSRKGDGYNCNRSEMLFLLFVRMRIVQEDEIMVPSEKNNPVKGL